MACFREINELERTILEDHYNELKHFLSAWDKKIIYTYSYELLPDAPYLDEICEKIEASKISELLFKTGVIPLSRSELTLKFNNHKLAPEDEIKYRIVKRSFLSTECDSILEKCKKGKLNRYEEIIFRSYCADTTKAVVWNDDNIYSLLVWKIPKNSPSRIELREKMRNANVSDIVFHAKAYRDKP
jgi:hypothetical protein